VGGAVHIGHPHVMGRADGILSQLGWGAFIVSVKKIGRLDSGFQQAAFAGGPVVHAGGRHEVTEVVRLKVQAFGEFRPLTWIVLVADQGLGVQVTIGPLGFYQGGHEAVDVLLQGGVLGQGVHGTGAFEPFVHITVEEGRIPVFALGIACGDFKVAVGMAQFGIVKDAPHIQQHGILAYIETVAPETTIPGHLVYIHAVECGIRAIGCLQLAIGLGQQDGEAIQQKGCCQK